MSSQFAEPVCPSCHRRIAAWKLDHCLYCGALFPAELKRGMPEPEALKWVERPQLPADAARQLAMMRAMPLAHEKRSRSVLMGGIVLSIPVFAAVFYMLYGLVSRYSPAAGALVLVAAAGFLIYLGVMVFRSAR